MQIKKKDKFQADYCKYLHIDNRTISKIEIENYWTPKIGEQLHREYKLPITIGKKPDKIEHRFFCLLIGIVTLLSLGMCLRADSIAQALREVLTVSVQEVISTNKH